LTLAAQLDPDRDAGETNRKAADGVASNVSGFGTFQTCRDVRLASVFGGKGEIASRVHQGSLWPKCDIGGAVRQWFWCRLQSLSKRSFDPI